MKNSNELIKLLENYSHTPWLALLRTVEIDIVRNHIQLLKPPILDLGCGDGFVAHQVFEKTSLIGLDIRLGPFNKSSLIKKYIHNTQADAKRLPYKSGYFYTVFSNCAMEHMDNLELVLDEIIRVSKPRSLLVTLIPSDRYQYPIGLVARILGNGIWEQYNKLHNHVNLLTKEEWEHKLYKRGFSSVTVQPYGSNKLSNFVVNLDLISKISFNKHKPFIEIKHNGNIGNKMLNFFYEFLEHYAKRIYQRERYVEEKGVFNLIIATKRN